MSKTIEDIINDATNVVATAKRFDSEAQFQFELAWEINNQIKQNALNWQVNLEYKIAEYKFNGKTAKVFTDILLKDDTTKEYIPIELKHKLPSAPANLGRFDFWWDVHRIEWLYDTSLEIENKKSNISYKELKISESLTFDGYSFKCGYAIMLTNDKRYWTASTNIVSKNFQLIGVVGGKLYWFFGTKKNKSIPDSWRDVDITLKNTYTCDWKQAFGISKYLILKVK